MEFLEQSLDDWLGEELEGYGEVQPPVAEPCSLQAYDNVWNILTDRSSACAG